MPDVAYTEATELATELKRYAFSQSGDFYSGRLRWFHVMKELPHVLEKGSGYDASRVPLSLGETSLSLMITRVKTSPSVYHYDLNQRTSRAIRFVPAWVHHSAEDEAIAGIRQKIKNNEGIVKDSRTLSFEFDDLALGAITKCETRTIVRDGEILFDIPPSTVTIDIDQTTPGENDVQNIASRFMRHEQITKQGEAARIDMLFGRMIANGELGDDILVTPYREAVGCMRAIARQLRAGLLDRHI